MRRWAWLGWFAASCCSADQRAPSSAACEGLLAGDRRYAFSGETVDLEACGPRGDPAAVVYQSGSLAAPGACPPELGGACLALGAPVTVIPRAGPGRRGWTAPAALGPVFLQLVRGAAPGPAVVVRVAVIDRAGDADGDGLSNEVEHLGGLDPLDPDVDDDGLSDGDEEQRGTSPFQADSDGDGLYDGEEISFGSDPLRADTDGDGLADAGEFGELTDPRDPDTDGDGLSDGEEVLIWRTSPRRADTDLDGLDDGEEVAAGTAPRLADHDRAGAADSVKAASGAAAAAGGAGASRAPETER